MTWVLTELRNMGSRVRVNVPSPLTVDQARQQLAKNIEPNRYFRRSSQFWRYGAGSWRVFGDVGGEVTLMAQRQGRSSWKPTLNGNVVPTASGSAVVGVLATPRGIVALTYVWLALVTAAAVAGLSSVLAAAIAGHGAELIERLPGLIPLVMVVAGALICAYGTRDGLRDGEYLLEWLAEILAPVDRARGHG